jgi:hypothetical protein
MYDRDTDTWFPQVLAVGIAGPHAGAALKERPMVWTSWERWRAAHPETQVLSTDTGFARNYQRDPYGSYNPLSGYYQPDSFVMFPLMNEDRSLSLVQLESVGVLAGLDQHPPKKGGAYEAVGLRRDGVSKQSSESLTEEGLHRIAQRIPLHQCLECRQGVQQGPLHVGHPGMVADMGIGCSLGVRRGGFGIEGCDTGHTWEAPCEGSGDQVNLGGRSGGEKNCWW